MLRQCSELSNEALQKGTALRRRTPMCKGVDLLGQFESVESTLVHLSTTKMSNTLLLV